MRESIKKNARAPRNMKRAMKSKKRGCSMTDDDNRAPFYPLLLLRSCNLSDRINEFESTLEAFLDLPI
jgi:hypothetical protein